YMQKTLNEQLQNEDMDAGKKLIIINSSFKFLIEDLFNKHVMFDKPPVETIKGILRTNKFTRTLFMDMVQKKFIEILGYNPGINAESVVKFVIGIKKLRKCLEKIYANFGLLARAPPETLISFYQQFIYPKLSELLAK
ncbi:9916_t:CDS:2, partial [Racocetra fulgida]